jgi:signal transduction histidine kinase
MTASLKQAEQAKNAFIADVTHELRTPLTVIKGTIETLEDGALDDVTGRGPLLASMQRESERLIRLVNDLLVLARADAGALKLEIQPLDLGELARSRCEHLATLAVRRRVELRVENEAMPVGCCALGDADRLAQVLDNLLDNAVRHSPENSTVTVFICQDGEDILCTVSDQGDGIPAEHLAYIFERFYRVDVSRNRQTGGAGLGLAIARALVLAQGGHIRAQSEVGLGTKITFSLPLSEDCHTTA